MGFASARTYDLEVWARGRRERGSRCRAAAPSPTSRRGGRHPLPPAPGPKPEFVHTLNGSGLALPRTHHRPPGEQPGAGRRRAHARRPRAVRRGRATCRPARVTARLAPPRPRRGGGARGPHRRPDSASSRSLSWRGTSKPRRRHASALYARCLRRSRRPARGRATEALLALGAEIRARHPARRDRRARARHRVRQPAVPGDDRRSAGVLAFVAGLETAQPARSIEPPVGTIHFGVAAGAAVSSRAGAARRSRIAVMVGARSSPTGSRSRRSATASSWRWRGRRRTSSAPRSEPAGWIEQLRQTGDPRRAAHRRPPRRRLRPPGAGGAALRAHRPRRRGATRWTSATWPRAWPATSGPGCRSSSTR